MMSCYETSGCGGMPWLEIFIMVSLAALFCGLFPQAAIIMLSNANPLHWSRLAWFLANAGFVLVLVTIRFRGSMRAAFRARRSNLSEGGETVMVSQTEPPDARLQRDLEWRERAEKRLPFQ